MKKKFTILSIILITVSLMTGCASNDAGLKAIQYPPTDKVETIFQKKDIPESCRVFSHLFVNMPAGYTGAQFVEAVSKEAESKGADMILIGQSRQCTTESELRFNYYGPDHEYKIRDWPAWSYGFEDWHEQGAWANIGYNEWGDGSIFFDYPILMQVVFLRCH